MSLNPELTLKHVPIQLSMGLSKPPRLKLLLILSVIFTVSLEGIYSQNIKSVAQFWLQKLSMSKFSTVSTLATHIKGLDCRLYVTCLTNGTSTIKAELVCPCLNTQLALSKDRDNH